MLIFNIIININYIYIKLLFIINNNILYKLRKNNKK